VAVTVTSTLDTTAYKVQGKTTDSISMLAWPSFFSWCVAFVVFTRVREMSKLFIACPRTWETAQTFTPPLELVVDLGRLRALAAATAARDGPFPANVSLVEKEGLSALEESVAQASQNPAVAAAAPHMGLGAFHCARIVSEPTERLSMGAGLAGAAIISVEVVGTSSSAFGLLAVLVSVNACCLAALPFGFPTRRWKTRMCSATAAGHPRRTPDAGVSRHVRPQTVSTKSASGATILADATEWPA